jgi:GTP-binding protein
MKFIDEAKIYVKAGDGGRGCVSFRREKFIPKGGPDGGNGGKGGDVVVRASIGHHTLLDLKYNQHQVAKRGGHGSGNNRTGRNAPDIEIVVPVGTVFKNADTDEILCDLTEDGQTYIIAKGGIGGRGNASFATSTNRAPRMAQEGMPGDELWVQVDLKILADVGIVGLPNAGKSTFISRVSAAKPKIADYPFTTLTPNLGVVRHEDHTFVIADIPGLIEGAHLGYGLGTKFLRHIERTSVLLHMIDISDSDRKPWEDFMTINHELTSFGANLSSKPQIVAFNKIDRIEDKKRIKKEVTAFKKRDISVFTISAESGEGIDLLLAEISRTVMARKALKENE